MTLYLRIVKVNEEYTIFSAVEVSLTPFEKDCYRLEIDDKHRVYTLIKDDYEASDFVPYNCIEKRFGAYLPNKGIFCDEEETEEEYEDDYVYGYWITEYKEGRITKAYFKSEDEVDEEDDEYDNYDEGYDEEE